MILDIINKITPNQYSVNNDITFEFLKYAIDKDYYYIASKRRGVVAEMIIQDLDITYKKGEYRKDIIFYRVVTTNLYDEESIHIYSKNWIDITDTMNVNFIQENKDVVIDSSYLGLL